MNKKFIIQVTVDNSGCDFDDDIDLVCLTVAEDITKSDVKRKIESVNKKLHKENSNGNCYADLGWNKATLMNAVCEKYGWSWEDVSYDICVVI